MFEVIEHVNYGGDANHGHAKVKMNTGTHATIIDCIYERDIEWHFMYENHHCLSYEEIVNFEEWFKSKWECKELKEIVAEENKGDYIFCTNDDSKAYVGDRIRVIGTPERFFYDKRIEVVGIIREIGWYDNDTYFGFILEDTNKFDVSRCEEISLIK